MKKLLLCLALMSPLANAGGGAVWLGYESETSAERGYCIADSLRARGIPVTHEAAEASYVATINVARAGPEGAPIYVYQAILLRPPVMEFLTSALIIAGEQQADNACARVAERIAVQYYL